MPSLRKLGFGRNAVAHISLVLSVSLACCSEGATPPIARCELPPHRDPVGPQEITPLGFTADACRVVFEGHWRGAIQWALPDPALLVVSGVQEGTYPIELRIKPNEDPSYVYNNCGKEVQWPIQFEVKTDDGAFSETGETQMHCTSKNNEVIATFSTQWDSEYVHGALKISGPLTPDNCKVALLVSFENTKAKIQVRGSREVTSKDTRGLRVFVLANSNELVRSDD